jgi:hypothetical protein
MCVISRPTIHISSRPKAMFVTARGLDGGMLSEDCVKLSNIRMFAGAVDVVKQVSAVAFDATLSVDGSLMVYFALPCGLGNSIEVRCLKITTPASCAVRTD